MTRIRDWIYPAIHNLNSGWLGILYAVEHDREKMNAKKNNNDKRKQTNENIKKK